MKFSNSQIHMDIPSSPTLISNRENKKNANVPDLNCVGGLSIATNQQSLAEQQGPGQLDILIREIAEGVYTERGFTFHTRAGTLQSSEYFLGTHRQASLSPPDWTVDKEAYALLP